MRYRKKPVVVEAEQFKPGLEDGLDTIYTIEANGQTLYPDDLECFDTDDGKKFPFIRTMEGKHYIKKGSYIITGVKGERYPCDAEVFEMTYEKCEDLKRSEVIEQLEKLKCHCESMSRIKDTSDEWSKDATALEIAIDAVSRLRGTSMKPIEPEEIKSYSDFLDEQRGY